MLNNATIRFLKEIKENNNKTWFDAHRNSYLSAKENFSSLVDSLLHEMVRFEPGLEGLDAKNCLFRINRDIRFSKDKTPYKNHLSASIVPGGKKSVNAGYYLHIQPGGNSFCGGGMWAPQNTELQKVRQEIDYSLEEFKKILNASPFKKHFGTLSIEGGQMLVNVPKGYEKDNPAGSFLKFKSYVAIQNIPDKMLTQKEFSSEVLSSFKALHPLIAFLNRAIE